jgi:glucose/arabinose dehydrogenase
MLMVGLTPPAVRAQTPLTTVRSATGLSRPVFVTHAPDDFERVFIVEQHTGRIKIMNLGSGSINPTPFLDVNGLSTGNEQGLLGLAFHPDYAGNGFFYVNFTAGDRTTHVRRYTVSANPDIADPSTATTVLTIFQPQSNHNGGWIGFGPDGYLYVATGDGGGGGDSGSGHTPGVGNGQDITNNLLGKLLRLDVNSDDFPADPVRNYAIPPGNPFVGVEGDDEIWAFGLRNPWRNAFDRETGDLWIADVGQNAWEELDFQPADSGGGENYGWRCREGAHDFNPTGDCSRIPFTEPIHEYSHGLGCSISGGYAYRGCAIPDLQGAYFFADFCSNSIWSLRYDGVSVSDFQNRTAELAPDVGSITSISSFGEDAFGEIYICDMFGGEVFKIVPDVPGGIVGEDCNENQVDDACDILAGTSRDVNGNGVPDECECVGDLDGDGTTGLSDLAILLAAYNTCTGDPGYNPDADIDDSGCVDLADLATLLADYDCLTP